MKATRWTVLRTGFLLVVAAAAGCSALQPAGEDVDDSPSVVGSGTAADTGGAVRDSGATARGGRSGSVADSALRALRDSARAMQARHGHAGDSARTDTTVPRPDQPRAEGEGAYPHGPVRITGIDSLDAIGPVYTPYDRGPVMRTGDYLDGLLKATLVPVIHERDLSPETWARFWVLVNAEGRVQRATLHLGSGHAAFDAAAKAVAERLRYLPAERDGSPVPVWVLARISLLMG